MRKIFEASELSADSRVVAHELRLVGVDAVGFSDGSLWARWDEYFGRASVDAVIAPFLV